MIRRIFASALIAGVAAGLFASLLQSERLVPLLMEAERYETAAAGHLHEDGTVHMHAPPPSAEASGLARTARTAIANVITGVGFALLLAACFATEQAFANPRRMDWRRGAVWGVAGYIAFSLAPAFGLPPDVPGNMRADLMDRQIWWLATALATAAGLALIAFARPVWSKVLAALLIALPHVIGAPRPEDMGGVVPAELAGEFAVASLVISGLFWIVLGGILGFAYGRIGRQEGEA